MTKLKNTMPPIIKVCAKTGLGRFDDTKRVARHQIRRMTDNAMVKRKRAKQQPVTE